MFLWQLQNRYTCIHVLHISTKPPHTYRIPTRVKIGLVHVRVIGKYDLRIGGSVKFHIGAFQAEVHSGKTCIGTC